VVAPVKFISKLFGIAA